MFCDNRNDVLWLLNCCPVIIGLPSRDYRNDVLDYRTTVPWLRNDVLWLLDCPPVITGMMSLIIGLLYRDCRNDVLWLLNCPPVITGMMSLIIGLLPRDCRNDVLWLLDFRPVIPGMVSFDYRTAIPWLPDYFPVVTGLLSCNSHHMNTTFKSCDAGSTLSSLCAKTDCMQLGRSKNRSACFRSSYVQFWLC